MFFTLTPSGKIMDSTSQSELAQHRRRFVAIVVALITAIITAIAVSSATPDGNLVVTLVPALVVGLAMYGLVLWRLRHSESK